MDAPAPTQRPRILLAAADQKLREKLEHVLGSRYLVETTDGWVAGERSSLDAVVGDLRGIEAMQGRSRDIPVILLSRRLKTLPAHDALHELPVREHELLERIEIQLELGRLRKTAARRERALSEEAGVARRRLGFVAEASRLLAGDLESDGILRGLATIAVPGLAQWCAVDLLERGKLVRKAAWHHDAFKAAVLERVGMCYPPTEDRRHPIFRVLASGKTEFATDTPVDFARRIAQTDEHFELLQELDVAAYICVPLKLDGKVAGVVSFGADSAGPEFHRADVILAEDLVARAGAALDRAGLFEAAQAELAERRRVEVQLLEKCEHEHMILESVDAMIWYKDLENRLLRVNRAAAEWAGLPAAQIEGRRAEEVFGEERGRAYHAHDLAVMAKGIPVRDLEPTKDGAGRERWVRRDTIPYRDTDGRVKGVVIFAVDVTEQKLVEDVLRANEASQREFVANVSHEFRTPVSAIKGFAETLRMGAWRDDEDRERFLSIIESNADRLTRLVEDLLTLSALEAPERRASHPVDVRSTALDCAARLKADAREAELSLSVTVPEGLSVLCDRVHLWQMLENLLNNAIRFNRPLGSVRVRAERRGDAVWIAVEDSGIGISSQDLPRVFERFYRVEKGATPGRIGLGLHIVKKLAEAHGGRVWAESELGAGSAFYIELPASDCRLSDGPARRAVARPKGAAPLPRR